MFHLNRLLAVALACSSEGAVSSHDVVVLPVAAHKYTACKVQSTPVYV